MVEILPPQVMPSKESRPSSTPGIWDDRVSIFKFFVWMSTFAYLSAQLSACLCCTGYPCQRHPMDYILPREHWKKVKYHLTRGNSHLRGSVWIEWSCQCFFAFAHSRRYLFVQPRAPSPEHVYKLCSSHCVSSNVYQH
jgi:hypothetical protein